MGLRINTNVAALQAQRNLGKTTKQLNAALERLASGRRVTRAGDDAAGLAISEGLSSQVRGLTQAVRNANDANGFLNVAEGALSEMTNIAQRLRELSVQAANGSIGPKDRQFLDNERSQLVEEFNRIAETTTFNTTKLLDGTFDTIDLQVGVQKGEKIQFTIGDARATSLGQLAAISGAQNNLSASVGNLQIGLGADAIDIDVDATDDGFSTFGNSYSAIAIARAINSTAGQTNVFADVLGTTVDINQIDAAQLAIVGGDGRLTGSDFAINGVNITGNINTVDQFVAAINEFSSSTGVEAVFQDGSTDDITLVAADGRNIDIDIASQTGTTALQLAFSGTSNVAAGANLNRLFANTSSISAGLAAGSAGGTFTGAIALRSSDNINIVGTGTSQALGFAEQTALPDSETALAFIDISTQEGAADALATVDATLQQLAALRADLGAVQNRLSAVSNNLSVTNENLSSARSQIVDADLAVQVAELTKAQILQQAGTAVLGQANASAQVALQLLQF